jgi:hypothetical protein
LQLANGHVLIRVADRGAAYPLRIDPMIQQGEKLTGAGAIGSGRFGYAVALSGDGNTALIGARYGIAGGETGIGAGAAWAFVRSGGAWTQQGGKLVGTGHVGEGEFAHVGEGEFGTSVALSDDGDTALIGGPADNENAGAAWIFTRSGSAWSQQGPKLTGAGETGEGRFGVAVALSADGDTALVGGLADNSTRGAAWLFIRSGNTWTQQGSKLTPGDGAGEGEFGTNVSLSADGDTALIGAWRDNSGTGAAWAFVNPPTPTSGAATSVGETGATLNGALGAGGSSKAYFQYGTTAAYGASTSARSVGASDSPSPLAVAIGGACAGNDLPLPARRRKLRRSGLRRRSDLDHCPERSQSPATTVPETDASAVQHVRQSASKWRAGNRLAGISRAKTPTGTTFSFSLNEAATVTFSFTERAGGRKAGTLTFSGHSGTNKVAFQGRISSAKKLKPGRYALAITAANSAGLRSAPKPLSFTIVR